ncbi:Calx-beta domain-containing protein [Flavobacterium aquiphilum]|uniref:Calx-beta domain-containing protein n=1 Tax=Flavobacterium aquiphilum TaxID=3003261 RepID=UPI00247FE9AF|nr:Calx-beta domain-containing protein [Flavobacterium aquiphilum]
MLATGTSIKWYDAATAGTLYAGTETLATGMYYASQTVNGCESSRTSVSVTVTPTPSAPIASAQTFCSVEGKKVSDLLATGTSIKWYDAATAGTLYAGTETLATGTYYASQTVNGCESSRTSVSVTVTPTPSAPIASAQTFCSVEGKKVSDLLATGTSIKWYDAATAGTLYAGTETLATGTYYASQTVNGCESSRTAVSVTVDPASVGGTVAGSASVCTGTNSTVLTLSGHTGTIVRWESSLDNFATAGTPIANTATTLTATNLTTTTSYRAVLQSGVCASANSASATVTVDALPSFSISNVAVVEGANAVFVLSLNTSTCENTIINVTTTSGTAGASDYTSVTTTVTIPAGQTSVTVSVPTTDDVIDEPSENFTLTGTVTSANTTNTTTTGTATINDNDATPTLNISSPVVTEGANAVFTVSLDVASSVDTVVNVVTTSGTAGASDYTSVTTTVTIPAGQTSVTVSVPTTDDVIDEPSENFTLTGTVTSANTTNTTSTGTATINDNDATPTLSISNPTVVEGANAVFTVSLDVASSVDTVVNVTTTSGTAGTSDYTSVTTTVTIPAGQTSVTVSVPTTDDVIDEPSENFTLTGTVTSANTTNMTSTGTATINDNDATPTLSISNPTVVEGANAVFTVSLDVASSVDTVVNVTTTSGTAGTSDYTSVTTTVTIPAGQTSVTVSVPTTDDVIDEPSENFTLTGTVTSANTTNTTTTGTATINDNDATPTASIVASIANASEPSTNGQFTVTLTNPISTDTKVTYTVTGTATNGTDYAMITNTVTIPANSLSTTIPVTVTDDSILEGNETVIITLNTTDNGVTVNTTSATVTIGDNEVASVIQANPDEVGSVVGINQTVAVINVLANDELNNAAVLLNSVNLSKTVVSPTGYMTLQPDGTVELLPNTPAGTYTLTYSICEKLNPANCSSATVTVTVVAPTMTITANSYCSNDAPYVSYSVVANNFTPTGLLTINWIDSANRVVATQSNMPLSGNVLWPGAVVDANSNPVDWPGWLLVNGQWTQGADGFELTRPAVTMQFVLNPTQNVTVNYPAATSGCNASPRFSIKANNDDAGIIDGSKALSGVFNALANDTFNGLPINAANVTVTFSASPNFTMTAAGLLNTLANIPGGTYTLTYNICEKANPNNCSTATITVFVSSPSIGLVKKANFNDENGDGYAQAGETITYTFEVKNKGNVPLSNITISDPLPGVTMTGAPLSLAVGETNTTQFKAVYVIKQTDINEGSISNQATVFGTAPNGRVVEDKSDDTDFDSDDATSLAISGCVIKVYNAVTPDGSGDYDKLVIRGLECYSDNSIQIFNRWGVLVFEREHYNNDDVVFKGFSEGRVTVERSQELPAGTYFYILKYRDSKSNAFEKSGYLYLNRK